MTAPGSTLTPPPREGSIFRAVVGLICVVGSMVGFGGLYVVETWRINGGTNGMTDRKSRLVAMKGLMA